MNEPIPEDAKAFFELANRFVEQANDLAEEHGRARVAAAILWAASRYGAFAWAMSGAPGKQSTEDALAFEEDNIVKCLKHAGEKLGFSSVQVRKPNDAKTEK